MVNHYEHSLIESYLSELNKKLQLIPKLERQHQIAEVKDHLYHIMREKENSGMSTNQAAEDTLREFLPPEQLAEGIIEEDDQNKSIINKGDTLFRYGTMLTVGSFGGLSIPLFKGELNGGIILPFFISLIVGIMLLNAKSIQWNENQLKNLKWISRILIGFLCVPLTFFAYRIIKDNSINYLSLSYLMAVMVLALIVYLFIKRLFDIKQIENY